MVMMQGEPGLYFFVLVEGKVEKLVNGTFNKEINAGQSFGAVTLQFDTKRQASYRTKTDAQMWGLSCDTFREILKVIQEENYERSKRFLNSVPLLQNLSSQDIEAILHNIVLEKYRPGKAIVEENEPGSILYLITRGEVSASQQGVGEIRRM